MRIRRIPRVAFVVLGVFLGFCGGYATRTFLPYPLEENDVPMREIRSSGYRFIRPLLDCEPPENAQRRRELVPFRSEVKAVVDACLAEGLAGQISVYFRDLDNGPWFSIYPEEKFVPASLLKVPNMIALFRLSEKNPELLKRLIKIPENFPLDWGQPVKPREMLVPGRSYTVEELVRRTIVYSDNSANGLLLGLMPTGVISTVLHDLAVGMTEIDGTSYLSIESYAAFFRVLYNATYLDRRHSELALSYLAESDFPGGLRAATPREVMVAQKFGHWRMPPDAPAPEQLHDCGIVYFPEHPYLLCVMTRGDDLKKLDKAIQRVAAEVYAQVKAQH